MALTRISGKALPSGSVIGHAKSYYTTKVNYGGVTTFTDAATISYTPKSSNSVLKISGVFALGGKGHLDAWLTGDRNLADAANHYTFFDMAPRLAHMQTAKGSLSVVWFFRHLNNTSSTIKVQFRSYASDGARALAINELFENENSQSCRDCRKSQDDQAYRCICTGPDRHP